MPVLYHFMVKGYAFSALRFRYLKYLLLGTKAIEKEWATRHLCEGERRRDDWGKGSNDWIRGYRDSQNHPHRSFLVETISKFKPSSILEIGCNCGPNLRLLAKKFPDAKIMGIDINPIAVQKGNEWFAQEGVLNVNLSVGKADELGQFQDKSFDVVFTDAVLIYIGPDKIKDVMREMIRITHRALILAEWHSFESQRKDTNVLGTYHKGIWVRDYVALFKQFVREEQIRITKISEEVWPDKNWSEVGAVIEVAMLLKQNMQVSVIIPTYNRVQDLDECLDSITVQTILPKEVLVIDNGTDINTKNLIKNREKEFEEKGVILKYIKNNENSLTVARNIGVKHSRGDIISFLDDDLTLDKDYYQEIVKVYKAIPNALGVTGYNQSGKKEKRKILNILDRLLNILGMLHFTTSFKEENRCRVFPSLTVSYPSPSLDKIINCEWLSGASTYKKGILEEFKFDEKLKKYSWGEDQDFPYRVFKKYPHSLFLTPYAKYLHDGSQEGRLPKTELIYMAEVYDLYLFYKIIDQTIVNKLFYLWGRTGRTIYKVINPILRPSKSKVMEIKYLIRAYVYCIEHIREIKAGDLEFFNKGLR